MPVQTSPYKTSVQDLAIEGISVRLLRIHNIDELYEQLISKSDEDEAIKDERIPYWADLWPSAIALSEHIVKHKLINEKTMVHEIACGLGLPGILAGKLGATVTFSDYLPEPLEFAKLNWELNNSSVAKYELLDWRRPKENINADLILASDVAYEKRSFHDLIKAFKLLCKPGVKLILSEPNRDLAKPFIQKLKEQQLQIISFEYIIPLNGMNTKVNVYEISN